MNFTNVVLTKKGQEVFQKLSGVREFGVLGGGTGLALQLGHRISEDFDFFLGKPIRPVFLKYAKNLFNNIRVLVNSTDELTFLTPNKVKVTLLYYPFHFHSRVKNIQGVRVLSLLDIAAAKAYTLNRRASAKDYVDLLWLLKNKISLQAIMRNAKIVHGDAFSEKLFLAQLVDYDDIASKDFQMIKFVKGGVAKKDVVKFFQGEVKM